MFIAVDTKDKFTIRVIDTGDKFTTGVLDTGDYFITGVKTPAIRERICVWFITCILKQEYLRICS